MDSLRDMSSRHGDVEDMLIYVTCGFWLDIS